MNYLWNTIGAYLPELLILIIILGIYHVIYERLISPTLRQKIRSKLHALLEEVHRLQNEQVGKIPEEQIQFVEAGLRNALVLVSCISLSMVYKTGKAVKEDASWIQEAKFRLRRASGYQNEELKQLDITGVNLLYKSFIVNSGGWFIYILPAIVFLSIPGARDWVKRIVLKLFPIPAESIPSVRLSFVVNPVRFFRNAVQQLKSFKNVLKIRELNFTEKIPV